jgi:heme exporter protein C
MSAVKFVSVVLVTIVLVGGIAIPLSPSAASWLTFPVIPGLGEKARNILFHVPVAWTTVVAFLMSLYFGVRYLRTRDLDFDLKMVSSAGLGLMFCVLATVTGSLWAKFNWGSFWNWDPRETSIFILLLIYGAYFALRSAVDSDERRATLSSVYAIIAGLTVPFFIFVLPRMVGGLHPGAKGDVDGSGPVVEFKMSPPMMVLFVVALIGFTLLYVWMLDLRIRAARLEQQLTREQAEG